MNVFGDGAQRPCTGCGGCAAICPKGAIRMHRNSEGFLEPVIGPSCVGCGLCRNVCVRFWKDDAPVPEPPAHSSLFAAVMPDRDELKKSASGGAAHALAQQSLRDGYAVAGVVYNSARQRAETVISDSPAELGAFQGSKYLQSCTAPAYSNMLAAAEQGRCFAVFGLPCQIFGLASAAKLRKVQDSFLFAELFCHGVPSQLLWGRYLDWLERSKGTGPLQTVCFRSKRYGWGPYVLDAEGANGRYANLSWNDPFYQLYFSHATHCATCFSCPFRAGMSLADVRLGDFWGPEYGNNREGVSAVLALTEAGIEWLGRSGLYLNEGVSMQPLLEAQSTKTYSPCPQRAETLRLLQAGAEMKTICRACRRGLPLKTQMFLCLKGAACLLPLPLRIKVYTALKSVPRRAAGKMRKSH